MGVGGSGPALAGLASPLAVFEVGMALASPDPLPADPEAKGEGLADCEAPEAAEVALWPQLSLNCFKSNSFFCAVVLFCVCLHVWPDGGVCNPWRLRTKWGGNCPRLRGHDNVGHVVPAEA